MRSYYILHIFHLSLPAAKNCITSYNIHITLSTAEVHIYVQNCMAGQWRYDFFFNIRVMSYCGCHHTSTHWQICCFTNSLFILTTKKTSLYITFRVLHIESRGSHYGHDLKKQFYKYSNKHFNKVTKWPPTSTLGIIWSICASFEHILCIM